MRKYLDDLSAEKQLNFTLLATPAEGLSGRFVRMDKKRYGVIKVVTDKDYYTNSFHVPVYYKISAFDKIKKEAPYHALTNAGHISYVELMVIQQTTLKLLKQSFVVCTTLELDTVLSTTQLTATHFVDM